MSPSLTDRPSLSAHPEGALADAPVVYVDGGTTTTRVRLAVGRRILARAESAIGVRDTARDGSNARLVGALREMLDTVRAAAPSHSPKAVVAFGMITSSLGLHEVPHVGAPAGRDEIARGVERHAFPDIADVPFFLIPGVRSGPEHTFHLSLEGLDVMRGEETLALGLTALGRLRPGGTLFTLGSHWKAVTIDDRGRVASSVTSASGELIHAVQEHTVLAASLPKGRAEQFPARWVEAGATEQRRAGLPRAVFGARMLDQRAEGSGPERLAFVIGAFMAADLDGLFASGAIARDREVVVAGTGPLARAFTAFLIRASVPATTLDDAEVEQGALEGARGIASRVSAFAALQVGDAQTP